MCAAAESCANVVRSEPLRELVYRRQRKLNCSSPSNTLRGAYCAHREVLQQVSIVEVHATAAAHLGGGTYCLAGNTKSAASPCAPGQRCVTVFRRV